MKIFTLCISMILSFLAFAQKPSELNWTYTDFMENNVKKVSKYSIPLRKNGEISSRDSTLIFVKEVDLERKIVSGIESGLTVKSHGGSQLTWNKFENHYNKNGLILKEISSPLEIKKKKEFGFTDYDEIQMETIYEYDFRENLVRKEYRTVNNNYSIYNSLKDTFHLKSIYRPEIYEYVYNSDNQLLKQYYAVDSTRYPETKSHKPTKEDAAVCNDCIPKYLNVEWKYDSQKRPVEWISYTRNNEFHTKRYYFYDKENRLKKQTDSTGWYVYKKPYWKSTKTYEYDSDKTTEITVNNTDPNIGNYYKQQIKVSDSDDNVIRKCKQADDKMKCTDYAYKWEKGKLVEKITTTPDGEVITEKFIYNNRNLLTEKSEYRNGKRTELLRYYYE